MKKLYSIFILTVFFSLFNNSYAVISTTAPIAGMNAATTPAAKPAIDIKKMSIAEVETILGHKLTWKQKLAMKLAKKRGGDDGSFGIGFLLGFFLGIIGVLIAYFAFEDEAKTRKGSWWGFGVGILIYIAIFAIVIAAAGTM